jgi:sugar-specific transcriptional regulator TrmB
MLENELLKLGFGKNEAKVYLALIELGKAKAGQIITHTSLHRNLVYLALEILEKRELVTKIMRNGVAEFSANDPRHLIVELEEQKNIAEMVVDEIEKKKEKQTSDVIIYEGEDGMKKSRNFTLQYDAGETIYVIGSKASSGPEMEKYWRQYHKKRIKKGIGLKIMYDHGVNPDDLVWRNSLENSKAKYLPLDIDLPIWFSTIKDYLEIGIPGDEQLVFGIKNLEAASAFKKFFEYFWNQEVVIGKGLESLEREIYKMLDELKPGDEYFVLGASVGGGDERVQTLYDKYHADRIKKGVIVNMLAYKEGFKKIMDRFAYSGDPDLKISHAKEFISAPPIPMQINIFKDKTFFIIYSDEPTIISFSQPEISHVFKNYFNSQWNQDSITFVGKEGVEDAYNSILSLANKKEDVVIFAAKPNDAESAEFNVKWAERLSLLCRKIKYIYYGETPDNVRRAKEIRSRVSNSEVRIIQTKQSLPISNVVIGDTALNTVWTPTPVCLVTKNKVVADSLRENFDLLWEQDTQILKGPEVVKNIWLDSLRYGELKFIGARGYFIDRYPEMFAEIESKARVIKNLKWRNVVDVGAKGHRLNKLPWMETRYTLVGAKNPNVVWLWGNKVAVANWTETEPVVFISTNKHLVQSYQDYFDELWNKK